MEKIERISETEVFIDGMKYIRDTFKSLQPEFQTGDWVVLKSDGEINRIREINGNDLRYDDGSYHQEFKGYIRHATPQEVEQHLRKICDEKYIGKKVKSLSSNKTDTIQGYQSFIFAIDQMWYSGLKWGILVYENGKFTEIVPEKKKLPKTKREFRDFLNDYGCNHKYEEPMDFLDDYEDD
jgi:hypothetical protein